MGVRLALLELIFGFHKTIYFNLRYFGIKGFLCPILISKNVVLREVGGVIRLRELKFGLVKLGFSNVAVFDGSRAKFIYRNRGELVFDGRAFLGQGVALDNSGRIIFGDNFRITANSMLICKNRIEFGSGVLISWNVQISDHDFHRVVETNGSCSNPTGKIVIGERVWICSNASVGKNVAIGSDVVVASGSVLASGTFPSNYILAGVPAKGVKAISGWNY